MVKLTVFHDTTPFVTGERVYLAKKVNRVCHLQAGMRIVIKWDKRDTRNADPRWCQIMHVEPSNHPTIVKLLLLTDNTYVDELGEVTNKLVWNVKTNQYGTHWCIYSLEGSDSLSDHFLEFVMDAKMQQATAESDIYRALLLHYKTDWD